MSHDVPDWIPPKTFDELMEVLKVRVGGRKWEVNEYSFVRCASGLCPILALYADVYGFPKYNFVNPHAFYLGQELGLSDDLTYDAINAADMYDHPRRSSLVAALVPVAPAQQTETPSQEPTS